MLFPGRVRQQPFKVLPPILAVLGGQLRILIDNISASWKEWKAKTAAMLALHLVMVLNLVSFCVLRMVEA